MGFFTRIFDEVKAAADAASRVATPYLDAINVLKVKV